MPITPVEILHREFRKSFRGYMPSDVKAFQREVAEAIEQLTLENSQLKQELERLRERLAYYESLEETLQNTLVLAQRTAEEAKENAIKRAELIVEEAQGRAQRIIEEAAQKAAEIKRQLSELLIERSRYICEIKTLLETLLTMLKERMSQWGIETEDAGHTEGEELKPPIMLATTHDDPNAKADSVNEGANAV
ncbi:MAG: hypothetical protein HZRFUVUK_000539 [Candidatus Fervidibacterota bacterium]|jgi:cell division initiation protein